VHRVLSRLLGTMPLNYEGTLSAYTLVCPLSSLTTGGFLLSLPA
jgi:hypothetical protein